MGCGQAPTFNHSQWINSKAGSLKLLSVLKSQIYKTVCKVHSIFCISGWILWFSDLHKYHFKLKNIVLAQCQCLYTLLWTMTVFIHSVTVMQPHGHNVVNWAETADIWRNLNLSTGLSYLCIALCYYDYPYEKKKFIQMCY